MCLLFLSYLYAQPRQKMKYGIRRRIKTELEERFRRLKGISLKQGYETSCQ